VSQGPPGPLGLLTKGGKEGLTQGGGKGMDTGKKAQYMRPKSGYSYIVDNDFIEFKDICRIFGAKNIGYFQP
jgi:hypothetical protein